MKKLLFLLLLILCLPRITSAQNFSEEGAQVNITPFNLYLRGVVTHITNEEVFSYGQSHQVVQDIEVRVTYGDKKGELIQAHYEIPSVTDQLKKLQPGDQVVLGQITTPEETLYEVVDTYRTPALLWCVFIFVVLVLLIGRLKGATALVGLAATAGILIYFFIPHITRGVHPFALTLVTTFVLSILMLYIAHGYNKQTSIAVIATLITLSLASALSFLAVKLAALTGLGTDTSYLLQTGLIGSVPLQGLFLSGVIIGTLGVLDDVTTTQTASIAEIAHHKPHVNFKELVTSGMKIGREHIASLVNTLFLAYVGTSLPLLLIFTKAAEPLWVLLNSEPIAEEVIRTLAGSTALILAVPITTLLAAYFYTSQKIKGM